MLPDSAPHPPPDAPLDSACSLAMGAGAFSVNASALFAEADDETLLSVLCQDVKSAQRLLRQAERLLWLGGTGPKMREA